ncbi:MAG: Ig-like domain-containing protein [Blastocatellia bacterium]|nr:Ig-like domain-containing protein [Blastocatellia bacterium]
MARILKRGAVPVAFGILIIAIGASINFQSYGNAAAMSRESYTTPQRSSSVRWVPDPVNTNRAAVEVSGLSAALLQRLQKTDWELTDWQALLSVYVETQGAADRNLPAMLGSYSVRSDVIRFEPQFPLEPGITYRAVFHPRKLPGEKKLRDAPVTALFQLPPRKTVSTTEVSRIYPSADLLPENLLKFYVHFSAPMSRGRIYDHIHLRDSTGKEIELPFLEIDEELWNPEMTRLTLFIDPGRIKRGVLPLEEIGPALEEGKSYALVIDREWIDATGNPLKESFQKVFKVGPPDREPPDPARWQIASPKSYTREPLTVVFPEPMDHALAERVIYVTNDAGAIVEGNISLDTEERRWIFVPGGPWPRGAYNLKIISTIEDLAGNNIGKPFEVDVFDGVQRRLSTSTVKLPFEVR